MDIAKLFRKNFSFLNKLLYKNNNQDQVITDQIVRLQNAIYNSKDWKILKKKYRMFNVFNDNNSKLCIEC